MLATRTIRSDRPADSGAGRLLAHLVFVITMVVGAVFAHGGACAAVELAESAGHSAGVRAEEPAATAHRAVCLHQKLPPGHQHGTEQDCSAIGPATGPAPLAMQEPTVLPAGQTCGASLPVVGDPHPLPGAQPGNLCVMRI
ncbi:hypothetical protein ABZ907_38345 [Nonomuraea wenchangensis]